MFTTDLQHLKETLPQVAGPVKKALKAVKDIDFTKLSKGRHVIDGDNIFAMVNSYETEPTKTRRPEKHFQYTDIQLILEGKEKIGYCPFSPNYTVKEDKKDSNDVVFYEKVENENFITLSPGDMAIFYPWEIHRPNCQAGTKPISVKKVVIKVKMG